jgi:hypothetical protein
MDHLERLFVVTWVELPTARVLREVLSDWMYTWDGILLIVSFTR